MKKSMFAAEKQRFSIRKYSFGAASVLLGLTAVLGGPVSADEQVTPTSSDLAAVTAQPLTTTTEAEEVSATETPRPVETAAIDTTVTTALEMDAETDVTKPDDVLASNQVVASETETVVKEVVEADPVSTTPVTKPSVEVTAPEAAPVETTEAKLSTPVVTTTQKSEKTVETSQKNETPAADKTEEVLSETKTSQAIYRLYNPNSGEHHYTASLGENNYLSKIGWKAEGLGWYAPTTGDAVYRLYNPNTGDHHYTVNKAENDYLDKIGWNAEGIAWYSGGSKAVYRLYNPNAKKAGSHHYTLSKGESDYLDKIGWNAEGIGWYALDIAEKPAEELPAQGIYKFNSEKDVKNQPLVSAKTEFTFKKGESINYDKVLEADGHQWISYVSYSGTRRYVDIAELTKTEAPTKALSGDISVKTQENGDFDVIITNVVDNNGVKSVKVPVWTTSNDQDDVIWYNAVKQNDGSYRVNVKRSEHNNEYGDYNIHLYYVENNGKTVSVANKKVTIAEPKASSDKEDLPSQGKYVFSADTDVRNEPKLSAKVEFYIKKGDSVNYDKVLEADGYQWISYVSNNGTRRYVALEKDELAATTPTKLSASMTIKNTSSDGFDIILSDVSVPSNLKTIKVPVWSTQGGQDDIIWYNAVAQKDKTYQVNVKVADHKNNTGEYNVHVYYETADGKMTGVLATRTTVPAATTKLPSEGVYHFTGKVDIKSEPMTDSKAIAYYDKGQSVNYDKVLTSDGHQWISYVSYNGLRRYIAID